VNILLRTAAGAICTLLAIVPIFFQIFQYILFLFDCLKNLTEFRKNRPMTYELGKLVKFLNLFHNLFYFSS